MNFKDFDWVNYEEFINYLFSLQDNSYKEFHNKLTKDDTIIGIKTPILKSIAKEISKGDYNSFIINNKHNYYEEIILHGLVITYLNIDFVITIALFDEYIKYITNWASCDLVVCNYKLFKKNLDIGFIKIKDYLNSNDPFTVRVGLVLLIAYYINDEYIDNVLKLSDTIKSDNYYVLMANAWLISTCLIKYYDKTIIHLKKSKLDDWTYNKAIQKAIESYRIKNKNELKLLKR